MSEKDLFPRIAELIRKMAKLEASREITPNTHLVDDLGIDSLDLVGIYLQIQDDFGVVVGEEDLPELQRIGDLTRYVYERLPAAAA